MQSNNSSESYGFDPETGFNPGVTEKFRAKVLRERRQKVAEDRDWLNKPFIPKGVLK